MEVIVARAAALDVHKDTVTACVRIPGKADRRGQEMSEFRTFSADLRRLRDWLEAEAVTQVAMEATGVYWKPVWHVLEDSSGFELLLVNAHHVKNVPGRKTDASDAAWLAQLLEDAGIKLDSVVSDVLGKSAREVLDALITGVRDPELLAEMARTRMRPKIPELRLALEGRFTEHHALMLEMHLAHVDHLTHSIARLDTKVDEVMAPFGEQARALQTIPGIGKRTAEVIVAEIGVDMSRFPSAGHLASWAGMCPGNHESAGKRRSGRARKGDAALRSALCESAWAAARTKDTYLAAQFRHLRRRFGKGGDNKAIFAVGHSILVIVWHLLANGCDYEDLGGDYFARRTDAEARTRYLIRQLHALGHQVTLEPAA
jgi:transposase